MIREYIQKIILKNIILKDRRITDIKYYIDYFDDKTNEKYVVYLIETDKDKIRLELKYSEKEKVYNVEEFTRRYSLPFDPVKI